MATSGSVTPATDAPRRTQAERTAESEERLLRAALKLIGERGYERTTLAAIGEEAGYSRGLVSHRYGSKAGLLGAITEKVVERWDAEHIAPIIGNRAGADALGAALDVVVREAESRPDELRALNVILFDPNPELRRRFAEMHANLRTTVRRMLEVGLETGAVCKTVDVETHAALFVSTLRGALYQWSLDPEAVSLPKIFAVFKKQLHEALEPKETI